MLRVHVLEGKFYSWELGQNAVSAKSGIISFGGPCVFLGWRWLLQPLGVEAPLEGLLFISGSWEWRGPGSGWRCRGEEVTGRGVRQCEREAEPQGMVQ